jgi:hypothetical protein
MVTGYFSFFDILPVTEFEIQTVLTEKQSMIQLPIGKIT